MGISGGVSGGASNRTISVITVCVAGLFLPVSVGAKIVGCGFLSIAGHARISSTAGYTVAGRRICLFVLSGLSALSGSV